MSCRPPPENGPSGGAPTQRQQEVLAYVYSYRQANGLAPTAREVCERFGFSSTAAAADYFERLEQHRLLRRLPNVHRGLLITESGEALANAYLREHPEVLNG
ncbi:hypothetical protein D7V80_32745 [Corallococcus sp. CA054B]|uniref:LexA family protein n=1 Tax=Corallococcus sp. CA054B TaxID=2316734 RepID=UPI000EA34DAE|nr:hypothetical protein [Corallococcus sp. CA054B]RKG62898.1 hypothetical protein D7V80_32745 [Corallococcus sp. CA054B]